VIGAMHMTDRILNEILDVEARAMEIESKATQKAREIIQEARTNARQLVENGITTDELHVLNALTVSEKSENVVMVERLETSASEATIIIENAQRYINQAVSVILKGVVDEYGHS